tara:strand:- start:7 stop:474 length:468 start_codon:yes stop_codon:yes gene_type:complete
VAPIAGGGTNWWSPAYSPRTGLLYVNSFDGEAVFFSREQDYNEGSTFTGGGTETPLPIDHYQSAIRAIEPTTGDIQWEFPITARTRAGVLATAGDLVFSASVEGYFYALDATTGEPLWHIALGGPVHAQPMSYAVNGQQFVTMTIGNTVYTFGLN